MKAAYFGCADAPPRVSGIPRFGGRGGAGVGLGEGFCAISANRNRKSEEDDLDKHSQGSNAKPPKLSINRGLILIPVRLDPGR
jgi:hypothetical protein